ncbi:unnamed protein product [Tuber melanosporum]|uniref:(Perigord truffle) hypothetical protein n=1 Tax=Tuber melanosporum (strain Mel28) TaxID=656061 RepID=D5GHE9_TUBMM|nr:uncharacterized protein GSTUM_00007897001 [Tuber melanosporum]CAZ83942.1 unnamed protein product [Tuber melanosporum]
MEGIGKSLLERGDVNPNMPDTRWYRTRFTGRSGGHRRNSGGYWSERMLLPTQRKMRTIAIFVGCWGRPWV